jgi:hypothetical protein
MHRNATTLQFATHFKRFPQGRETGGENKRALEKGLEQDETPPRVFLLGGDGRGMTLQGD